MRANFKNRKFKNSNKNNKNGKSKLKRFTVLLFLICTLFIIILLNFDRRMFPVALRYLESEMVSTINTVINNSTLDVIANMKLKSDDFYEKTEGENGKINSMSINTILINRVCGEVGEDISKKLNIMGTHEVQVPIGTLSEIESLSNLGPKYTLSLLPMGDAQVDYNSSFESVGINQVNFQIWLIVETRVKVINPMQSKEINISRKIPLVNTIINSDIPDTYLNINK